MCRSYYPDKSCNSACNCKLTFQVASQLQASICIGSLRRGRAEVLAKFKVDVQHVHHLLAG